MKTFTFKIGRLSVASCSPLVEMFCKKKDGNRLGLKKQKIILEKMMESTIRYMDKTESMYDIKITENKYEKRK